MSIQSEPKFKFLLERIKTWESCSRQHAVSIFNVISTAAALCSLFLITLYPPASAAGAFRKSQELKNWLQCKEWHSDVRWSSKHLAWATQHRNLLWTSLQYRSTCTLKSTLKTNKHRWQIHWNQDLGAMLGRGGYLVGAILEQDGPEERFFIDFVTHSGVRKCHSGDPKCFKNQFQNETIFRHP